MASPVVEQPAPSAANMSSVAAQGHVNASAGSILMGNDSMATDRNSGGSDVHLAEADAMNVKDAVGLGNDGNPLLGDDPKVITMPIRVTTKKAGGSTKKKGGSTKKKGGSTPKKGSTKKKGTGATTEFTVPENWKQVCKENEQLCKDMIRDMILRHIEQKYFPKKKDEIEKKREKAKKKCEKEAKGDVSTTLILKGLFPVY